MRVLLAFDKFKDSMTAPRACAAAAGALRALHPDWELDLCPLSDGGEGFCEILTRAADGDFFECRARSPRGAEMTAKIGLVDEVKLPRAVQAILAVARPAVAAEKGTDRLAVVEMAAASGLALLAPEDRDPWRASSAGAGDMIRVAGELGARSVLLGVGGSATNDLGLGALEALGLRFIGSGEEALSPPLPSGWSGLECIQGMVTKGIPPVIVACDVENPLLGPRGATFTYGPQKGLRPEDAARLDAEAARMARLLCAHCGRPETLPEEPGMGAAGGIAFGLVCAAGARLTPGFELVSAWLGLEERVRAADLVLTGEGRFDDSSLMGKGPGAVAARALALGKAAHVFAGRAEAAPRTGLILHSITPADMPLRRALIEAEALLGESVARVFG